MDVRRLVDRVAEVLGAAATPERVEAVAAIVLEASAAPVQASAVQASAVQASVQAPIHAPVHAASPGRRVLVVAYGVERPGVPDALARAAEAAGCPVAQASRQVLDGYFSLLMLLDASEARVSPAELQQRLTAAATRQGVGVLVVHEWLFKTTRPESSRGL